jgi:hypothetical protein
MSTAASVGAAILDGMIKPPDVLREKIALRLGGRMRSLVTMRHSPI